MREVAYCIVGGGVAGLAAANRLGDLGKQTVLIEAGSYPKDQVCGEFLSPEILPLLTEWGIQPVRKITRVQFHLSSNQFISLPLAKPAGSLPRAELELQLLARAKKLGVEVITNCRVLQSDGGQLILSNGEELVAKHLLMSIGTKSAVQPRYFGKKAHFDKIHMNDTLEMHLFPGGYVGVSPVGDAKINIAMLSDHACELPDDLTERVSQGLLENQWLSCRVPEFGRKNVPLSENHYCIGEAAVSIPPITGEGLSMAIESALLGAEFAAREDWRGYPNILAKRFRKRVWFGKLLHHLLIRPRTGRALYRLCETAPWLLRFFYRMTRS